jgi:hypothetical protein
MQNLTGNSGLLGYSVSVTARRCGIARSLYSAGGPPRLKRQDEEKLVGRSHRPKRLGCQKFSNEQETLVLKIRNDFNYGKLRICSHLLRHHELNISTSTVVRILKKHAVKPIRRFRKNNPPLRYAKLTPGERVQQAGAVDVCKIKAGWYQYTAILHDWNIFLATVANTRLINLVLTAF